MAEEQGQIVELKVSGVLMQEVVNYLAGQPYGNVAHLIAGLTKAEPVIEPVKVKK